jgi:mannose-6-phosphate isomerase-like protein (cupin superfamily)
MITFYKNYFRNKDTRGLIIGLVNKGNWKEINYFETSGNQIRANHYHKETDELFIILKGKMKITLKNILVDGSPGRNIESYEIKKGDVFVISKMTYHTFEILQKSVWLNALSIKMDKKNPDFHSL